MAWEQNTKYILQIRHSLTYSSSGHIAHQKAGKPLYIVCKSKSFLLSWSEGWCLELVCQREILSFDSDSKRCDVLRVCSVQFSNWCLCYVYSGGIFPDHVAFYLSVYRFMYRLLKPWGLPEAVYNIMGCCFWLSGQCHLLISWWKQNHV